MTPHKLNFPRYQLYVNPHPPLQPPTNSHNGPGSGYGPLSGGWVYFRPLSVDMLELSSQILRPVMFCWPCDGRWDPLININKNNNVKGSKFVTVNNGQINYWWWLIDIACLIIADEVQMCWKCFTFFDQWRSRGNKARKLLKMLTCLWNSNVL